MVTVRHAAVPASLTGGLVVLPLASSGACREPSDPRVPHSSSALPW